ncbi:MAG: hypothetical protein H2212_07300 [Ruminococcus sp.]|nr:hypothetical protein [Ruminococcus sp.]
MRFDIPVFFQNIQKGKYDPIAGKYKNDILTEVKRLASVTNASTETLTLVYGEIRRGACVVRIQNHYTGPFEFIRIGDKQYRVDYTRPLKVKHTFVVSEVK